MQSTYVMLQPRNSSEVSFRDFKTMLPIQNKHTLDPPEEFEMDLYLTDLRVKIHSFDYTMNFI